MRTPTNKAFKEDISNIQFKISESLLKVRRRSPITIAIEVCESFANYAMNSRFNLNYTRYRDCHAFLQSFSISGENYYEQNCCYRIVENSFRMKLRRPKTNQTTTANGLKFGRSKNILSLHFRKENDIQLTPERQEELENYAANQHNIQP